MGCFNDLPQDVIWLIFQRVIWSSNASYKFEKFELDGWSYCNDWGTRMANTSVSLALINHRTLKAIRSKTIRLQENRGWWFIKGALTGRLRIL